MKKGLILTNAYTHIPSQEYQAVRLREEFNALGVNIDVRCNDFFACKIVDSEIVCHDNYDFVIYLDKDKYMSEMLERTGVRLFNSHRAILDCDDKMCTYIKLAGKGVPVVDTLSGLLCYDNVAGVHDETVRAIESEIGYPVIVKECYGSLGKGVYKCNDREELIATMERVKHIPHLFQRCITTSVGKDIRVIVIGGTCVAAMLRESDGDFRSNLALGGHGTPFPIDKNVEKIALDAVNALGLDYAGVDLLFGSSDMSTENLLVCEVNSNAFFGGIEKVTHVNIAKAYADYIMNEVYVDKNTLIENANRIGISIVAMERCKKKLRAEYSRDEILKVCKDAILVGGDNIHKKGKNWYVDAGNIRYTINASTYMIVTADVIK